MSWTRTTLATHLMGELNDARNAAGGSVPDRLANLIHEAYKDLWLWEDWRMRRRRTTFSTAADTATVALPSNFDKLDQQWVKENNENSARLLTFTDNVTVFESCALAYGTDTHRPRVALFEATTTDDAYSEQLRLTPTPDGAYTYDYYYLCTPPDLGVGDAALWPSRFEEGWAKLARSYALGGFRRKDESLIEYGRFRGWVNKALSNNEAMVSSTPLIEDAEGDSAPFVAVTGYRPIL